MTRPFSDKRVADRLQRLVAGRIEEAAGVDDDQVGAVMLARDLVALGAQPGDDALGIDKRLRASEADEADAGAADIFSREADFLLNHAETAAHLSHVSRPQSNRLVDHGGRNGATRIARHRPCGAEGRRHRAFARLLPRHAGLCRDDAAQPRRRLAVAGLSAHHRHAVHRALPGRRGRRARRAARSTAINHFCLECADLDATAAALRDSGITAHRRAQDGRSTTTVNAGSTIPTATASSSCRCRRTRCRPRRSGGLRGSA